MKELRLYSHIVSTSLKLWRGQLLLIHFPHRMESKLRVRWTQTDTEIMLLEEAPDMNFRVRERDAEGLGVEKY